MKRYRRKLLNAFATLTLALFLATAVSHAIGGWRPYRQKFGRWDFSTDGRAPTVRAGSFTKGDHVTGTVTYHYPNPISGPVIRFTPSAAAVNKIMAAWSRQTPPYLSLRSHQIDIFWGPDYGMITGDTYGQCFIKSTSFYISLSYWLIEPLLLSTSIATWAIARRMKEKVVPVGGVPCPTCGYDLRATPDQCPECGTAIQVKPDNSVA